MFLFSGTGRFSAICMSPSLLRYMPHVRHAVGLHSERLSGVLARAKAHAGEVFVLPSAPVLVSGKLRVGLLGSTDRAAGIENSSNQHLAGCAPVPGRKCRQNDVPGPSSSLQAERPLMTATLLSDCRRTWQRRTSGASQSSVRRPGRALSCAISLRYRRSPLTRAPKTVRMARRSVVSSSSGLRSR